MFINPKVAVENGWIQNIENSQIQPNAIDITADRIFRMDLDSPFFIGNGQKTHRDRIEVHSNSADIWLLSAGSYDFVSNVYVDMPEDTVGWVRVRSTLNRNGINVGSGFYDSGYRGPICGTLYVTGLSLIKEGTPVGQFIFARSDSEGFYEGGYNANEGELPNHIG